LLRLLSFWQLVVHRLETGQEREKGEDEKESRRERKEKERARKAAPPQNFAQEQERLMHLHQNCQKPRRCCRYYLPPLEQHREQKIQVAQP
jgi:hypothetical protein